MFIYLFTEKEKVNESPMKRLIDVSCDEAQRHFLKGSSYFNSDFPDYISFEPILNDVASVLNGKTYNDFKESNPDLSPEVNYKLISNKDGKFSWRPFELIHPVIYVSLVNLICENDNWNIITSRFSEFEQGVVECCSQPVISMGSQSDKATQVQNWWQKVEQRSIAYSLRYSHVLHTDVTDCYGSIYTHSIPWAIHTKPTAKEKKGKNSLLGNKIDKHIQVGRYGQTNGIPQGSVLMDFIAELVLGYVDDQISSELDNDENEFSILRYRDDYRIFANSDERAEMILKKISDKLRDVGMRLGASKTNMCKNVIEGSIKPDKLAGIDLQDLGKTNAKTIQKQLLRLHSFGRRFPNSGALRRLISNFHDQISKQKKAPEDLEVQVAIATDIGVVSPITIPAIAGILSYLISLAPKKDKPLLWNSVRKKMQRVPYNGYLEIWLQRVTKPDSLGIDFFSNEPICKIVDGECSQLWESSWIGSKALKDALLESKIMIKPASEANETISPEEVALFKENAWAY